MKRCRHYNGELIEFIVATHSREYRNGQLDEIGFNEVGEITGYQFHCLNCDKWFSFKGKPKQKWLRRIYWQLRFPNR